MWRIVLGVVGEFWILIDRREFFSESEFCMVEFAVQASRWIRVDAAKQKCFSYDPMESGEGGLIQFLPENERWRVFSPYQNYEATSSFTFGQLKGSLEHFFSRLEETLHPLVGRNVSDLISGMKTY